MKTRFYRTFSGTDKQRFYKHVFKRAKYINHSFSLGVRIKKHWYTFTLVWKNSNPLACY